MNYRIVIFDAGNFSKMIQPFDLDKNIATSYDNQGDAVWSAIQLRKKFKNNNISVIDTNWVNKKRKHLFVLLPGATK